MLIRIAIDAMGGDFGPHITLAGSLIALQHHPQLHLVLVGDLKQLAPLLEHLCQQAPWAPQASALKARLSFHHAPDAISMQDPPAHALRTRKHSSMHYALHLLAANEVQACVSAGNTGALMAISRHIVKTWPQIERPAISTAIPTLNGHCQMLDLGANISCEPKHLLEFALMGSLLTQAVDEIPQPRVALLNVGAEATKGTVSVKQAARLLAAHPAINYTGYVEGKDIFRGCADVIVCDGFVGNIALKTSEGLAQMLIERLQNIFAQNLYRRLLSLMARPVLAQLKQQMDPVRYNGASLLGLKACVIKSHGEASARGFAYAIARAMSEYQLQIPQRLAQLPDLGLE
ncbi:glycerol-3-phosphate acyltransferase PlsX [Allopseudospirillum japonicum]|uniref:Phosphate acyltransferase n=1 Tax=Allopseudospirillum japonicum TaxID=64971 RepID=A0A1H6QB21_9GAMM|nr:phosphate acyltransferase PlsX [Allopseudospirillum japonicum]SEI39056.1 glycerol-3-phosphate acyltransferase PlsX [Allopseudospirillum japonicum]